MIVALSGWKGSGKDTAASILVEKYGFRRIAFADVLKDMVADQYGIDRTSLDDPKRKESPLLNMPVLSTDKFSEMIHEFMIGELRDAEGKGIKDYGFQQQLYWTPRALAILEGSTKRSANSQYWIKRALSQIKPEENIVLTDMRYQSEAVQVHRFGEDCDHKILTVRIERFDSSPSVDPSERDLDSYSFDYTVPNKSTLKDLADKIGWILEQ